MKVTVSKAAPSPLGLILGLRVEDALTGWVRFAVTTLVVSELTFEDRQALLRALNHSAAEYDPWLDQPAFSFDAQGNMIAPADEQD